MTGMRVSTLARGGALVGVLVVGCSCSASHAGDTDGAVRGGPDGAVTARDGGIGPGVDAGELGGPDTGVVGGDAGWTPPPYDGGWGDRSGDVWEGYVESYLFQSGSDHVRIVFDSASADGPRTGIVVFGAGAPPPPVSDPDVGYPPGIGFGMSSNIDVPWEGFEYPIASASVSGARVLVTVELGTLWSLWCSLQMPVPSEPGSSVYTCVPNTATVSEAGACYLLDDAGTRTRVDCGKLQLCHFDMVCSCDATSCRSQPVHEITLDFHVVGTNGDGSVTLTGLHNVHLVRM